MIELKDTSSSDSNSDGDHEWDPTYQYRTSPSPTTKKGWLDTHVLSVCLSVDAYPETREQARRLARAYGPELIREWVDRGLPSGDLYYLVHRPGERGPSEIQRIHRADQADALAREEGGVAVVIAVTNVPVHAGDVVSRVRLD